MLWDNVLSPREHRPRMLDRRFDTPDQNVKLTLIEEPENEPVDASEGKKYIRADEDVTFYLTAAREVIENEGGGLCIMPQKWKQVQTGGLETIQLYRLPVTSLDSVTYFEDFDSNGEDVSENIREANGVLYHRENHFKPGRKGDGYVIEYTCGLVEGDAPKALQNGILRLAAFMYENREAFGQSISEGNWSISYAQLPFDIQQIISRYHTGLGLI